MVRGKLAAAAAPSPASRRTAKELIRTKEAAFNTLSQKKPVFWYPNPGPSYNFYALNFGHFKGARGGLSKIQVTSGFCADTKGGVGTAPGNGTHSNTARGYTKTNNKYSSTISNLTNLNLPT
jgi:hypothetical protein